LLRSGDARFILFTQRIINRFDLTKEPAKPQLLPNAPHRPRRIEPGVPSMVLNLAKLFRRNVRRFRGAQHGTTAIEFALIAPVFIALLVAIFETTLFLFAQANLQNAATQAGRVFMTGQAQNGNMTQSQFQNNTVCPLVQVIFNCNNLVIVVQSYASYSSASTTAPQLYNSNGTLSSGTFSPGSPGELMIVQIAYPWSLVTGPLGFTLANQSNGTSEIMGISAFRVEPYGSSS
jgi:Flp pilus assembly protein TadG